tara:strand:- start:62381 stop:62665 length:285 start_codon:yes stop_codon:yes gene_type:complete
MKGIVEVQNKIQQILSKMNQSSQFLDFNHRETGNIENIINASKSLESGDFRKAMDEVQEVINQLNEQATELMNQIEHTNVQSRYPDEGPKKHEQ